MTFLETRIPPPLVVLASGALAWGVTPKIIKDTEDFEELTRFAAEASSEFTGAQSENLAILLAGLADGVSRRNRGRHRQ